MKKYVIGIEVGASRLQYGLFDDQLRMTHMIQRAADTEMDAAQMMDYMEGHIRELTRNAGITLEDVRGIGAAFPSYIDFEHGYIIETSNIPALNNVPVRDLMEQRLGVPIWLDNDANVAAARNAANSAALVALMCNRSVRLPMSTASCRLYCLFSVVKTFLGDYYSAL